MAYKIDQNDEEKDEPLQIADFAAGKRELSARSLLFLQSAGNASAAIDNDEVLAIQAFALEQLM